MREARATQGSSEPALHRHKSEYQLRRGSIANRASGISQRLHRPSKPVHSNALPTLADVTTSILAREGRCEGGAVESDAFVRDPRRPCESRNETVGPIATPPINNGGPRQKLKRALPSKAGLNQAVRRSVLALFRKTNEENARPKVEKKISVMRREPSITAIQVEVIEEENEEEAAFWRMVNGIENAAPLHQASSIATTRQSRAIRRSASFAGWKSPTGNRKSFDEGSLMDVVYQLREAWNEEEDVTPDFDERSDEE
jgi:hypothetical protein